MTDATIDIRHAEKVYRGKVRALRGVSMRVGRGEVFGLLGPNGAGKSTLVKIMMTIVRPTRCEGTMLGAGIGDKAALRRVGYLPEHLRFPEYLTGEQALDYLGGLNDVPRDARRKRAEEAIELVGMSEWRNKKIGGYSKGMKQRLGVAQALMNDPDLVLLDEPTDGVDPVGRRDIRNVLVELKNRGKTVFLNSHLLGEVEMVCDRVSILVQGKVAMEGSLDELTHGGRRYEIEVERRDGDGFDPARAIGAAAGSGRFERGEWRGEAPGGVGAVFAGAVYKVDTTDARAVQPMLDALRAAGVVVRAVRPVRPTLEDLFVQAVTDPETGRARGVGAGKNDERAARGGER